MATYKKKIISLFISLDKDECIKFRTYLNSPYFKIIEPIPKLYDLIVHEYKVNKSTYNETDLVQKVYGEQKISRFRSHLQKLRQYFEDFIALQYFDQEQHLSNQFVLEDYLHRKSGCFFEKKHKKAIKELEKSPMGIDYYQHQYKLEEHLDSYLKTHKDNRVGGSNLQCTSNAIERNFILKKLCCLVLMYNRQNITDAKYDFGFEPFVIEYLSSKSKIEEPLINLFYKAYLILKGPGKKIAFENLNKQLQKKDPLIAREVIMILLIILQNNQKHNTSLATQLHQELFNLYNILLKKNYIQVDGKLPINFYRNVVSIGLELDKFDYVDQFIENYKNKLLPETLADKAYAYNKAKFLIYKGKPLQAQELIINLHFNDILNKFDLKCLQVMIYYELKEDNLLTSCIGNFRSDLAPSRAPSLSEENRNVYRNFNNAVNKLYNFRMNPNTTKNDIQKLTDSIQKTNRISNRKWLLMKAEELLK